MKADTDIRSIIIVGGGTAGWMAACYLNRFLGRVDARVTLIESPSIETIGVGEATLPSIVRFVRNMGFDEMEFMRECKATYKLGIKFKNWIHKTHSYWHPFGLCGSLIDGIDLFHFWVQHRKDNESYSDYSLQALVADNGKSTFSRDNISNINETGAYAYHLDAGALADYLKDKAVSAGVKHICAEVKQPSLDNNGNIEEIRTEDGQILEADLYVDCTGFRGLLIDQTLKVPFIDWSAYLLCDRAVALSFQADDDMPAHTHSIALDAGWSWHIPLSNRLGSGYVYSSTYKDADDAVDELKQLLSHRHVISDEPRFLSMPVGHRQQFWKGNCLCLGLAGGFLEPLESTGIHLIQYGIETFMDYFPDREMNPSLINIYNEKMLGTYAESRDFLMLHYYLSERDDTPFWRDCRNLELPASLHELLNLYDEAGIIETQGSRVFPDASYFHILSGGQRYPRRAAAMINVSDQEKVRQIMANIKGKNLEIAGQLPEHKSLIELINKNQATQ